MLNIITLQGRFTADPEVKETATAGKFVSFLLASERGKDKAGNKVTDFIPCMAWGKTAEFLSQYFHKGDMALISGRLQSRNYETQDGSKRCAYEVYVQTVDFCGSNRKEERPAQAYSPAGSDDYGYQPTLDFEL